MTSYLLDMCNNHREHHSSGLSTSLTTFMHFCTWIHVSMPYLDMPLGKFATKIFNVEDQLHEPANGFYKISAAHAGVCSLEIAARV